ncbi:unnamed protein product, partial [Rotaria sp. Silwood1]
MIATRLTSKRKPNTIFYRSNITNIRHTSSNLRHYRSRKLPLDEIPNANSDINENSEDVHENTKFKFPDRSSHALQIRPGHSKYDRMQAPILSFDEEGDIPLPDKRSKFLSSPDDTQASDSANQVTILKPSPGSISIERTRKDRFRHAVRTVSKVAFSQLGL